MITDEQLAEEQQRIEQRIGILTRDLYAAQGALAMLRELQKRAAEPASTAEGLVESP